MNTEWRRFLEQAGARISQDLDVNFNNGQHEPVISAGRGLFTDLSRLSLLEVSGNDAPTFLNGQFTTDITLLPDGRYQYSAWCNPQGRVIALFIIYRMDQTFCLLIPAALKDRFLKRLRIYILRSDVVINDRSGDMVCTGIISSERLQELSAAPDTARGISRQGELTLLRLESGFPSRLLVLGPVPAMISLWRSLQSQLSMASNSLWRYLDISTGTPWIHEVTSELFLPQELNLDTTGGLSYDKGCFPGQEVIARVHYRGKVKQRLHRSSVPAGSPPAAPGEKLYAGEANDSTGTILDVADSGAGEFAILAVADTERAAAGPLCISGKSGPSVHFEAVPGKVGSD